MSKKTFRKGVALATGLSFGLVGLTAMPATADSTGRITLVPDSGSTFNSLITDGFDFSTSIDGDLDYNSRYLTYKISNPGKADLAFDFENEEGSSWYNVYVLKNGEFEYADYTTVSGIDYYDDATLFVQAYEAYTEDGGWVEIDGYYDADLDESFDETITEDPYFTGSENYFHVDTREDSTTSFTVQAWLDKDENGLIDTDETSMSTDAEAVTLYDPKSISATVKLDDADLYRLSSSVSFTAKLSNDINVGQIDADQFAAAFYLNGNDVDLDNDTDLTTSADSPLKGADAYVTGSNTTTNLLTGTFYFESGTVVVGNYSARLAWIAETADEDDFWVGSRSASFSVANGTNSDVDALAISTSDSKNTVAAGANEDYLSPEDFDVRPGTKSVTLTAQALEVNEDDDVVALKASNVRVRAIVEIGDYVDGTKVTVSGSSESLTSDSGDITVYGRTDADGKFSITVTSTTATDGEGYSVDFEYLDTDGSWYNDTVAAGDVGLDVDVEGEEDTIIQDEDIDIDYVDAYVDTFEFASDILSGSSVKATVSVEDQYGQAISTLDGDALKVFLTDSEDFEKSVNVSSGKAEFSFTNWLTKGDIATLEASLYTGSDETDLVDVSTSDNPIEATLYNPEATGAVIVDAEADINITQEAFIVGEEDADADIVAPSENELVYEGIVEDANGAGLPAAVVTIKGAGLQFEEITDISATPDETAGEWFKDSITVVADETGYFAVNVWAHKVGETVITVTSGGKSDSTTLTAAFGALTEDDVKISWDAPKHPAINGLYAVTIKVTDLWGNAIEGADLEINTDGALQVNGDDTKDKTTNAAGKATVYVGGVKDLKGFGSITAEVVEVAIDADDDGTFETDLVSEDLADGDYTSVTQEVLVGVSASAAAGKNAGVVVAKAWNTKGKTLQVYVGGKLKATKTTVAGVDTVKLTGIKAGSKLVTIKVAGSTYFSGYVTVK